MAILGIGDYLCEACKHYDGNVVELWNYCSNCGSKVVDS